MTTHNGPGAEDSTVDAALHELRELHSSGAPDSGLEGRILAQVAATRQRRRRPFLLARWSSPWPGESRSPSLTTIGSLGLVVVLVGAFLATTLPGPRSGSGSPAPTDSTSPSAGASDLPASNPPHVGGTCPVTPISRLAGGVAPEVDASGLRWRWGGVPWVAGTPEKVVWLADTGDGPTVSVFATELDLPILVNGHPISAVPATAGAVYAVATDTSTNGIVLDHPGCWLLTAVWSLGASSVVVAVAPPTGQPVPLPSSIGPVITPFNPCPATPPSTLPAPQGESVFVDGPFRWLLGSSENWQIGGAGDKLVLDYDLGWGAGDKRVIAVPVAKAAGLGRLPGSAVGATLPRLTAARWASGSRFPFAIAGPLCTSTRGRHRRSSMISCQWHQPPR